MKQLSRDEMKKINGGIGLPVVQSCCNCTPSVDVSAAEYCTGGAVYFDGGVTISCVALCSNQTT